MDDTLYGTTRSGGGTGCYNNLGCGTVFSLNLTTGAETILHSFTGGRDGAIPESSLTDVKGILYGTTEEGGNSNADCFSLGCGTIFSIDLGTGAEKVLYTFCGQEYCTDGASPDGALLNINGALYGTTFQGGAYGFGTIFSLTRSVDPSVAE